MLLSLPSGSVLPFQVDVLESLEILQESNVDGVIVTGNHFLQVTRQSPFRIQANLRSVVTGKEGLVGRALGEFQFSII